MQDDTKKVKVTCPECDNEIVIDSEIAEIGDIIECPVCGANLEIVSLDPVQVQPITTYK